MLSHSAIQSILPHRYPMLLVDRVTALAKGVQITAVKNVTANEPCFAGLIDGLDAEAYAYPNSMVIESFCQAAGILYAAQHEGLDTSDKVMLFGSISKFRFSGRVFPGQTMEHRVRIEKALTDSAVFSGEVWVDGQPVAEVERVVVVIRPASSLADSARG